MTDCKLESSDPQREIDDAFKQRGRPAYKQVAELQYITANFCETLGPIDRRVTRIKSFARVVKLLSGYNFVFIFVSHVIIDYNKTVKFVPKILQNFSVSRITTTSVKKTTCQYAYSLKFGGLKFHGGGGRAQFYKCKETHFLHTLVTQNSKCPPQKTMFSNCDRWRPRSSAVHALEVYLF